VINLPKTLADLIRERIEATRQRLQNRTTERPLVSKVRKRMESFRSQSSATNLTEKQKELAEKFRQGIAEALGVPPEAIKSEPVYKWVEEWTKAFVKPEYLEQIKVRANTAYSLGYSLGEAVRAQLETQVESTETRQQEAPREIRKRRTGFIY